MTEIILEWQLCVLCLQTGNSDKRKALVRAHQIHPQEPVYSYSAAWSYDLSCLLAFFTNMFYQKIKEKQKLSIVTAAPILYLQVTIREAVLINTAFPLQMAPHLSLFA